MSVKGARDIVRGGYARLDRMSGKIGQNRPLSKNPTPSDPPDPHRARPGPAARSPAPHEPPAGPGTAQRTGGRGFPGGGRRQSQKNGRNPLCANALLSAFKGFKAFVIVFSHRSAVRTEVWQFLGAVGALQIRFQKKSYYFRPGGARVCLGALSLIWH